MGVQWGHGRELNKIGDELSSLNSNIKTFLNSLKSTTQIIPEQKTTPVADQFKSISDNSAYPSINSVMKFKLEEFIASLAMWTFPIIMNNRIALEAIKNLWNKQYRNKCVPEFYQSLDIQVSALDIETLVRCKQTRFMFRCYFTTNRNTETCITSLTGELYKDMSLDNLVDQIKRHFTSAYDNESGKAFYQRQKVSLSEIEDDRLVSDQTLHTLESVIRQLNTRFTHPTHHIAFSYDASNVIGKFYINDVLCYDTLIVSINDLDA